MLCFLFSACNTTKFLNEEEVLLKYINIAFEGPTSEDQTQLKSELEQFYLQKPNGNFIFIPREYFRLKNPPDKKIGWLKKGVRKVIGEDPTIVDTLKIIQTSVDMQLFLRNKKGYYNAEVNYDIEFYDKQAAAIYYVNTGKRYTINSIRYITKDPNLKPFVDSIAKKSILKESDPIDAFTFDIEKQRILKELQNKGFADFSLNYIDIKGDTSDLDKRFDVFFEILNPAGRDNHQRFKFGDIHIYTDYHRNQNLSLTDSTLFAGKFFHKENEKFIVNKKAINSHIYFNEGERYNRDLHYKTIKNLSALETYRFTKFNATVDPQVDSIINYDIYMTPHRYKWIADTGLNLFYTAINTSSLGQKLIGFSVNGGVINRNLLGGAEKYSLIAETGFEFQLSPFKLNTYTLSLQNNIEFPRLIDVLGTFNGLRAMKILPEETFTKIRNNSNSAVSLGYTQQNIVSNYNIGSFNVGLTHSYQPTENKKLLLTQLGFDLNSYKVTPTFLKIIGNNQLLLSSFEDNFFSGFFFRDLSYFYQSNLSKRKSYFAFLSSFELSGGESYLVNKVYNLFSTNDITFKLNDRFDFANFARAEFDFRWYKQLSSKSVLATRMDIGIATPYADNSVVPYIKQFFSGGPNSIRAWQSRELGAGSYRIPPVVPPFQFLNQAYYQTGDVKLEMNLEYRFDIWWVIEGAFFVDAGNVWTLKYDNQRIGSQFTSDFLDQIAVGGGWGLRWDFDYFIIRFDFGYKLRNPYETIGASNWVSPFNQGIFGNVNVAINYPF